MDSALYSHQPIQVELQGMGLVWHVGDVIRKLRQDRRWNQSKLGAEAGGIDKGTISRLEKEGETGVSIDTIIRAGRALGFELRDLYPLVPPAPDQERLADAKLAEKARGRIKEIRERFVEQERKSKKKLSR